jgi:lipoyl-dependent peroxiredoxin
MVILILAESHLEVKASVPNIDAAKFNECVEEARVNCPISKLYNTKITAEATLEQGVHA